VATTLDELAHGDPLQVTREVLLPVSFSLLGRPGTRRGGRPGRRDPSARRGAVPAVAADVLPGARCC
jgi:hypothetical protein